MLVSVVALAGCYQGPSADLACKLRCTDSCPAGLTCTNGVCVGADGTCAGSHDDAALDAAPSASCITQVGLGFHHVCVIKTGGTVWCAGENATGQLGNDTTTASSTEVQARDGSGPITDATALAASGTTGTEYTCAIRSGGTVWCWGYNADGELGNNDYTNTPHAVQVVTSTAAPLTNIVEIGAGAFAACARDSGGKAWCWGDGANGRLGDGTYNTRSYAMPVQDSSGQPFTGATRISVGRSHACLLAGGNVWCWGTNDVGRVGDGSFTDRSRPVMIESASSLAAGRSHTCDSHADGTASCWGWGWHDRIGSGTTQNQDSPTMVLTAPGGSALTGIASVAAGGVSCALMTDSHVECWGANVHGQTGNGGGSIVPVPVIDRAGNRLTNVDAVYVGFPHVCAHTKTGQLLCWGRNANGEYATGTLGTNVGTPSPLGFSCP